MRLDDGGGDRQTQACAARLPGSRLVRTHEPLEEMRQHFAVDAGAVTPTRPQKVASAKKAAPAKKAAAKKPQKKAAKAPVVAVTPQ